MFYFLTIIIAMICIIVVNIIVNPVFFNMTTGYIILAVIINTIAVIAVDGVFATIIRHFLPQKWFSFDKRHFEAGKKECRFYEKLGIKKWKDKVLELGMFTNFRKNKLKEPNNNAYIERFISENNYGIIVHIACIFFGFLVIFIYPLKYVFCFGVPVACVNAFLNLLPIFILRYNTPKLRILHKANERRERLLKQENKTQQNELSEEDNSI